MKFYAYFNGRILPAKDVRIGISDLGLLRSYAVFDYMRTYNGIPFYADAHLTRFFNSASELHLSIPCSKKRIKKIIGNLLAKGKCHEAGIRLMLTGGYANDSMTLNHPNFIILTEKLPHYPDEIYKNGVKLITYEYQRVLPLVKSTNYLTAIRLKSLLNRKNAYEVLYCYKGEILEVSRNNFFMVKRGVIVTPSENVLHGITRKIILDLASGKFKVRERKIKLSELNLADEAFICGTSKRIVPVVKIDTNRIGTGRPGPITREIMNMFSKLTLKYTGEANRKK
ncbi:MAG: aminotransferase class IV family protein [Bacteroidetes bacterium]|nr:aminotransferase class IV family protein [Bacteroidota bacterium]